LQSEQAARAQLKIKALLNADRKKSVHVTLFAKTHIDFKQTVVAQGLSMQEVFEHLASLIADGHPQLKKILDDYTKQKKDLLVSKLEAKYTDNLYDAIGHESPFGEKE
jgi:hypothetical protein